MTSPGSFEREARERDRLLVPVLSLAEGPPDAVAVAAWHLAFSNLVGVEIPHDLLGLWVFPPPPVGGVLLLAPAELAQDALPVPAPAPMLTQHQLFELEDRVRRAGYRSVIAVPARGPDRDHGLALFAALESGRYGVSQALRLQAVFRDLVPTFAALGQSPPLPGAAAAPADTTVEALPGLVARAAAEARTGADLLRLVSGVLQPVVPHERLEVAFAAERPTRWVLLSGPGDRQRWGETGDQVTVAMEDLLAARQDDWLDIAVLRRGRYQWPAYTASRSVHRIRSLLGFRLGLPDGGGSGRGEAWLLMGGAAPGAFCTSDRAALEAVAPVLALRVHGLRQSLTSEVGQAQLQALQSLHPRLARLIGLLATTEHWGEASRAFAREACSALGYHSLRFALRWGEEELVRLRPGDLSPLSAADREPLDLAQVGAVVRGTAAFLVSGDSGCDLAVPLRIAGRSLGALEFLGRGRGEQAPPDHPITGAQLLADLVAPHLELIRRAAQGQRAPGAPGLPFEVASPEPG